MAQRAASGVGWRSEAAERVAGRMSAAGGHVARRRSGAVAAYGGGAGLE